MNRAPDYLDHMLEAAQLASSYIDGMDKNDFIVDKRTQQAAIMNLVIIGKRLPNCCRIIRTFSISIRTPRGKV